MRMLLPYRNAFGLCCLRNFSPRAATIKVQFDWSQRFWLHCHSSVLLFTRKEIYRSIQGGGASKIWMRGAAIPVGACPSIPVYPPVPPCISVWVCRLISPCIPVYPRVSPCVLVYLCVSPCVACICTHIYTYMYSKYVSLCGSTPLCCISDSNGWTEASVAANRLARRRWWSVVSSVKQCHALRGHSFLVSDCKRHQQLNLQKLISLATIICKCIIQCG